MKLHIESDGTRKGTKLLCGKDEEIENVSKIEWVYNEDEEFVKAIIHLREVRLNCKTDGNDVL